MQTGTGKKSTAGGMSVLKGVGGSPQALAPLCADVNSLSQERALMQSSGSWPLERDYYLILWEMKVQAISSLA